MTKHDRYNASEKGQARRDRYEASERGQRVRAVYEGWRRSIVARYAGCIADEERAESLYAETGLAPGWLFGDLPPLTPPGPYPDDYARHLRGDHAEWHTECGMCVRDRAVEVLSWARHLGYRSDRYLPPVSLGDGFARWAAIV